jgi:hypothetical protein
VSAIELSTEQRQYLTWYRRAVWFGVVMNLWFCLTAWFAPERILRKMGLDQTTRNVWLRNVGMLLVNVSLFNAVAALDPTRYPLLSWSVAAARLIASSFFLQVSQLGLRRSTERPKAFAPLMIFDFTMAVVCAGLLYKGLYTGARLGSERRLD